MMDSLLRLTLSLNRSRKIIEILKKAVSARMCTDSRSILCVVKLGSYPHRWPYNCVSLVVAHGRRRAQRFPARCIFCVL